jgi:hypothetical protein
MPSSCASPRVQRPASADQPAWLPHPPTLTIQQRSPRRGLRGPAPDRVRRAPPSGSTVTAPCGSGSVVPVCVLIVGLVGAWQRAKGGDAWWAAGRRAGPGKSASSPERGSTRAAAAPAGPGPTTPVRAPRKPATGAARRAALTAGRSTATATCSTWSTAPGRWRPSSTGCGGSGGRASTALSGMGCGHDVDGWRAPPRGAARLAPRGNGSTARASRPPPSVATGGPQGVGKVRD